LVGEIASKSKKKSVYIVSACDDKEKPSVCMERVIDATSAFIERYVRHEFDQNRSVKITIESFDIDGDPAGYVEFSVHANRFETDNYKLGRMLKEAAKHATSDMKSTHIAFM